MPRIWLACDTSSTSNAGNLSDEAAAKLIDFLLQLAHQLENHYSEQLYRYHNGIDDGQPNLRSQTDPHV